MSAVKLSVPLSKPDLPAFEEVDLAIREILTSGCVTNFGRYATTLELDCSQYLGINGVTVSSGTMGLLFALQAVGVGRGQHVVVPSFTFSATVQAIIYAGATPIFVDIANDLNLDPQDLALVLEQNDNVAAVFGTHANGLPCEVDEISTIVSDYKSRVGRDVPILYDAAHAFGSRRNGRAVGSFGSVEVFSVSATKAFGCVEGGLVASHNPLLVERIKRMRNYGIEADYNAMWPGLNGKMSEFHAIVGLANLQRLDERLAIRAEKAAFYEHALTARTACDLIPCPADVRHTFTHFAVLLPFELCERREQIITWLKDNDVETRTYWSPPVHEQTFFTKFAKRSLPRTTRLSRRVLTLPFFSTISEEQMTYVAQLLGEAERRFSSGPSLVRAVGV